MKYLLLLFLISCQNFVQSTNESEYNALISNYKDASEIHIVFSHNISGETHPCGCRHFPLGGLPQVAGKIHEIREKYPTIFVDTGDTFFPNANIPGSMKQSLTFTAENLNKALNQLKLNFYTPGDQDFAREMDFLTKLNKSSQYEILVSNFSNEVKIKHSKWKKVSLADLDLYFVGVIDNDVVLNRHKSLLNEPISALKEALAEIKNERSKKSRIILMSHSGMEKDKLYAKKFPEIDWIIGAHSQSFTKDSVDEGSTRIVQVLSRNHYLGDIAVNLSDKKKDKFVIHEMRAEQSEKLKNNPFDAFLRDHKASLQEIQIKEQDELSVKSDPNEKVKPASSCLECHSSQHNFWQGTPHSISYYTLHQAKAQHNPECIKCHSVNFMKPSGFFKTENVVILKDEKKKNSYWNEFATIFKGVKSVRKLNQKQIRTLAQNSDKLDKKFETKHNFANVQCLNCHDKSNEHPFEIKEKSNPKDWVTTCTSCHTTDQSPQWYKKDEKGLARELDKTNFSKMLKSMSCPKRKE